MLITMDDEHGHRPRVATSSIQTAIASGGSSGNAQLHGFHNLPYRQHKLAGVVATRGYAASSSSTSMSSGAATATATQKKNAGTSSSNPAVQQNEQARRVVHEVDVSKYLSSRIAGDRNEGGSNTNAHAVPSSNGFVGHHTSAAEVRKRSKKKKKMYNLSGVRTDRVSWRFDETDANPDISYRFDTHGHGSSLHQEFVRGTPSEQTLASAGTATGENGINADSASNDAGAANCGEMQQQREQEEAMQGKDGLSSMSSFGPHSFLGENGGSYASSFATVTLGSGVLTDARALAVEAERSRAARTMRSIEQRVNEGDIPCSLTGHDSGETSSFVDAYHERAHVPSATTTTAAAMTYRMHEGNAAAHHHSSRGVHITSTRSAHQYHQQPDPTRRLFTAPGRHPKKNADMARMVDKYTGSNSQGSRGPGHVKGVPVPPTWSNAYRGLDGQRQRPMTVHNLSTSDLCKDQKDITKTIVERVKYGGIWKDSQTFAHHGFKTQNSSSASTGSIVGPQGKKTVPPSSAAFSAAAAIPGSASHASHGVAPGGGGVQHGCMSIAGGKGMLDDEGQYWQMARRTQELTQELSQVRLMQRMKRGGAGAGNKNGGARGWSAAAGERSQGNVNDASAAGNDSLNDDSNCVAPMLEGSFPERRLPPSRRDVILLRQWMHDQMRGVQKEHENALNSSTSTASARGNAAAARADALGDHHEEEEDIQDSMSFNLLDVLTEAMSRLIQQVGIHCSERGALLHDIWDMSMDIMEAACDSRDKHIEKLSSRVLELTCSLEDALARFDGSHIGNVEAMNETLLEQNDALMVKVAGLEKELSLLEQQRQNMKMKGMLAETMREITRDKNASLEDTVRALETQVRHVENKMNAAMTDLESQLALEQERREEAEAKAAPEVPDDIRGEMHDEVTGKLTEAVRWLDTVRSFKVIDRVRGMNSADVINLLERGELPEVVEERLGNDIAQLGGMDGMPGAAGAMGSGALVSMSRARRKSSINTLKNENKKVFDRYLNQLKQKMDMKNAELEYLRVNLEKQQSKFDEQRRKAKESRNTAKAAAAIHSKKWGSSGPSNNTINTPHDIQLLQLPNKAGSLGGEGGETAGTSPAGAENGAVATTSPTRVPRAPKLSRFVEGFGSSSAVPKFLRTGNKQVRNRLLTKMGAEQLAIQIMQERQQSVRMAMMMTQQSSAVTDGFEAPLSPGGSQQVRLDVYIYNFLRQRYGVQSMIMEWGYSLMDACNRFESESGLLYMFRKLCFNELSEVAFASIESFIRNFFARLEEHDTTDTAAAAAAAAVASMGSGSTGSSNNAGSSTNSAGSSTMSSGNPGSSDASGSDTARPSATGGSGSGSGGANGNEKFGYNTNKTGYVAYDDFMNIIVDYCQEAYVLPRTKAGMMAPRQLKRDGRGRRSHVATRGSVISSMSSMSSAGGRGSGAASPGSGGSSLPATLLDIDDYKCLVEAVEKDMEMDTRGSSSVSVPYLRLWADSYDLTEYFAFLDGGGLVGGLGGAAGGDQMHRMGKNHQVGSPGQTQTDSNAMSSGQPVLTNVSHTINFLRRMLADRHAGFLSKIEEELSRSTEGAPASAQEGQSTYDADGDSNAAASANNVVSAEIAISGVAAALGRIVSESNTGRSRSTSPERMQTTPSLASHGGVLHLSLPATAGYTAAVEDLLRKSCFGAAQVTRIVSSGFNKLGEVQMIHDMISSRSRRVSTHPHASEAESPGGSNDSNALSAADASMGAPGQDILAGQGSASVIVPIPCSTYAKNLRTNGDTCLPLQMCSPFLLPGGVDPAEAQAQLAAGRAQGTSRIHQFGSRLLKARTKMRENNK